MSSKHYTGRSRHYYRMACGAILTTIACCVFFNAWYEFVKNNNRTGSLLGIGNLGMSLGIYLFLYCLIGNWLRAFRIGIERVANIFASQVLTIFVVDFIETFVSCAITGQFRYYPKFALLYSEAFAVASVICCLVSYILVLIFRRLFPPISILEIYGDQANDLAPKMAAGKFKKYSINDHIQLDHNLDIILGKIKDYDAVLLNDLPAHERNLIIKQCYMMDKRVYYLPKLSDIIIRDSDELNLTDTPIYLNRNRGMSVRQRFVKRVFDIFVSLFALILFSPLLFITAILIHLEDKGPVFFRQERVTIGGKRFNILKFRSMIVDAEKDGKSHPAGEHDDRITKVGRVIRATRLDELPQLINILAGDMSIVGPRPERWEHVEKYTQDIPEFVFRNKVKGGLTGYAQVYGKYNTTALDKLKMDLTYITNYSFLLDLQIIFETIKIIFHKDSTEGFTEEESRKMHDASAYTYRDE